MKITKETVTINTIVLDNEEYATLMNLLGSLTKSITSTLNMNARETDILCYLYDEMSCSE